MLKRKEAHFKKMGAIAATLILCSVGAVMTLVVVLKPAYGKPLLLYYMIGIAITLIVSNNAKCVRAMLTALSVVLFVGKLIICLPAVVIVSIIQGVIQHLKREIRYFLSIHRAK